ncbi:hypothetical protein PRIPAC_76868, partial [Pristionchus pacificus]|uniref:Uncharacterized protein n=1 Tax=Pristionchus pacificus TaxID=54126 RepID=A0A2A6CJQ2_PRIPA
MMLGCHLALIVVFTLLVKCESVKPPNVHPDVLLEQVGTMWMKKSTIQVEYTIGVSPSNDVAQSFCGSEMLLKQRSIVKRDTDSIAADENNKFAALDDTRYHATDVNWFEHRILGPIIRWFCKIRGNSGCVPDNTLEKYDEIQRNLTYFIKMAEDNMIQVEESNLLETIIDESVLPLHMRNDPHLQNLVLDRAMRADQDIDLREALFFAQVTPLGCTSSNSILLSIVLVDFRDAAHTTLFQVMHAGSFNLNKTMLNRMRIPSHIAVDSEGKYKFVDLTKCAHSGFGNYMCPEVGAVVPSACDLETLSGCALHDMKFVANSTGDIDVIVELGMAYVIATNRQHVYTVTSLERERIRTPPSGILKIKLKQDHKLIVGTRTLLGMDPYLHEKEHEPNFSWESQEVSSNNSHVDSFGNKHFMEEIEHDDEHDEKHRMETSTEISEWDAIFDFIIENLKLYYIMSAIDIVVLTLISILLKMIFNKVQAVRGPMIYLLLLLMAVATHGAIELSRHLVSADVGRALIVQNKALTKTEIHVDFKMLAEMGTFALRNICANSSNDDALPGRVKRSMDSKELSWCLHTDCSESVWEMKKMEAHLDHAQQAVAILLLRSHHRMKYSDLTNLIYRNRIPLSLKNNKGFQIPVLLINTLRIPQQLLSVVPIFQLMTTMKFSILRCTSLDSATFRLVAPNFMGADGGAIMKVEHIGAFSPDRSRLLIKQMPPYAVASQRDGIQAFMEDECTNKKWGIFVCHKNAHTAADACNLATLNGCSRTRNLDSSNEGFIHHTSLGDEVIIRTRIEEYTQTNSKGVSQRMKVLGNGIFKMKIMKGTNVTFVHRALPQLRRGEWMELKAKTENMLHIAEWTTSDTESAVERHHSFGDSVKYWLIEGFIPFGGVVFYEMKSLLILFSLSLAVTSAIDESMPSGSPSLEENKPSLNYSHPRLLFEYIGQVRIIAHIRRLHFAAPLPFYMTVTNKWRGVLWRGETSHGYLNKHSTTGLNLNHTLVAALDRNMHAIDSNIESLAGAGYERLSWYFADSLTTWMKLPLVFLDSKIF